MMFDHKHKYRFLFWGAMLVTAGLLLTACSDAFNNLRCFLDIQFSHGNVVQHKKGCCSLDHDVVHTHSYKIDANGVMFV